MSFLGLHLIKVKEDILLQIQFLNSKGDSIEYFGEVIIYTVHAHKPHAHKTIKGKNTSNGAGKEN